jgi:hypothetical protein
MFITLYSSMAQLHSISLVFSTDKLPVVNLLTVQLRPFSCHSSLSDQNILLSILFSGTLKQNKRAICVCGDQSMISHLQNGRFANLSTDDPFRKCQFLSVQLDNGRPLPFVNDNAYRAFRRKQIEHCSHVRDRFKSVTVPTGTSLHISFRVRFILLLQWLEYTV